MTVHRIFVSSESRLSGHRGDFVVDTSAEFARFEGRRVMCAVEFCDVVRYSDRADYTKDDSNPSGLLLECPDMPYSNSYQSWDGAQSCVLALLQNYAQAGVYGLAHDLPYVRKATMGVEVDFDFVKRLGTMRFRLRRCCDPYDIGDLDAVNSMHKLEAYAFQLVFWEPCSCLLAQPSSYDYYRAWVSSKDRSSGSIADCHIPVLLNTSRSIDTSEGKWKVALEYHTPVFTTAIEADRPPSIALLCPTLVGSEESHVLGHMGRSYRTGEENAYGQRYSIKPMTRDVIGHELRVNIEQLASIRLQLANAIDLSVLGEPTDFDPEYVVSLLFYRVK